MIAMSPGPKEALEAESSEVMYSLEGAHLNLSDAKLISFPSFLAKRHRGRPILEFVTSIDCSVNRIRYDPFLPLHFFRLPPSFVSPHCVSFCLHGLTHNFF